MEFEMSDFVSLAQKVEELKVQLATATAELVAAAQEQGATAAAPKTKAKRAPRVAKEGEVKLPSLKEVVQKILVNGPLEIAGIRKEVEAMIARGEYASNATSLSAVVSQAVNALKGEELVIHDRESKQYSLAPAKTVA
jgi:hypothetical protein